MVRYCPIHPKEEVEETSEGDLCSECLTDYFMRV